MDEVPLDDMLRVLEDASPRSLTVKELAERLKLERYDRRAMAAVLNAQAEARRLHRVGKTRYRYAHEVVERRPRLPKARRGPSEIVGRYVRVRGGFGFVEVPDPTTRGLAGDLMIPRGREMDALHGDRVRALILRRDHRTGKAAGRVVGVVERAHTEILGRLELVAGQRWRSIPSGWRLLPLSDRLPPVEVVGTEPPRKGDSGRMALVRLTRPPVGASPWRGELVRLLGDLDDPEVQFLQIALEHGLPLEFPADVVAEAARLPVDPRPSDLADREDLRDVPFVTIDGETARDFDDAVSVEASTDGGFRLRVGIADVAHYVAPGSALDAEAARRGTSVYFPDRAIPMLPERLSNELCSLKPDRDRAVVVADMDFDARGRRVGARLFRAVLRSRARLTYTEVATVLKGGPESEPRRAELGALVPQLERMRELMRLLYARRLAGGALDLNLPEAVVDLDDAGHAENVRYAERNDAHRLIEEFMLEANQAVAGAMADDEIPIPYRIHEPPEKNDLFELNRLLHTANVHIDTRGDITPALVATALEDLRGHALERVLSRQILRALKQARYETQNVGHFGLGFSLYCHFTSPIRRYPDLLVHRQLVEWMAGQKTKARSAEASLTSASEASSRRERDAMDAERAMLDLKKTEFMQSHTLEPYAATIVSIAGFGFFAELDEFPVEGLVPIEDLPGEWRFDERDQVLYGVRSGRRLQLGDRVVVEATEVSVARRQITLQVLEMPEPRERPRKPPPSDRGPRGRGGPPAPTGASPRSRQGAGRGRSEAPGGGKGPPRGSRSGPGKGSPRGSRSGPGKGPPRDSRSGPGKGPPRDSRSGPGKGPPRGSRSGPGKGPPRGSRSGSAKGPGRRR